MESEKELSYPRKYEIMIIFPPNLGEGDINQEIDELKKQISSVNGKVYHEDNWGLRDLAFVIKHKDQGYYYVINIDLEEPEKINEIRRSLTLNQNVLRFLIVKVEKNYEIKTLEQYALEEAKEAELKEAEKKEEKDKQMERTNRVVRKPVRKEYEKKEESVKEKETVLEPEVKAEKPSREKSSDSDKFSNKESKSKLDEVDDKLKSLINDPDINL